MVDLDAKNIMNASKENAKEWALELGKTLNKEPNKYNRVQVYRTGYLSSCLGTASSPSISWSGSVSMCLSERILRIKSGVYFSPHFLIIKLKSKTI